MLILFFDSDKNQHLIIELILVVDAMTFYYCVQHNMTLELIKYISIRYLGCVIQNDLQVYSCQETADQRDTKQIVNKERT